MFLLYEPVGTGAPADVRGAVAATDTTHVEWLTDGTLTYQIDDGLILTAVTQTLIDLQNNPGLSGRFDHLSRLLQRGGHRLFAEDVETRPARCHGLRIMAVIGRADRDCIHLS